MPEFVIDGIALKIPSAALTPPLIEALKAGRYENTEAAALKRHLQPGDRVLELGAGAGFLAAIAARIVGPGAVMGVEGSERMARVAAENLARNGSDGATLVWGAAVEDGFAATHVDFDVRPAFWASSRSGAEPAEEGGGAPRREEVPALALGSLIARHDPTVLVIDIEGGELGLFTRPLPGRVRLIVMEIHPKLYGPAGIKRIFDVLSAQGLGYCPFGSRGATVVFQRVEP